MSNLERLSENRVKITVEVSAADFDEALDKALEEQIKKVKVDGFRPGKMPKSMFISRFGWEVLYEDAINAALDKTYYPALMENKVYPTGQPKIDLDINKIKKGEGFEYTVEVDVWPEVHLGEYKNLDVKKGRATVTAKEVDAEIEKTLKNKADNIVKEEASQLGDTVVIDFEGFIDGTPFEGGKGENYNLELGSNTFIPGFEEQLVGLKAGDEKDVVVTFPENYAAELAGKEATFKCKVHEVKNKSVPTLDDEFVKDLEIEGVSTVEEYKEHVKKDLKEKAVKEVERKFEEECLNKVFDSSYAEFPESLITSTVERRINSFEKQSKDYKVPLETLLTYYGYSSLEDCKKKLEEETRKQYLQELVFDKIFELENIEATSEEIEKKYLEIAGSADKVEETKKRYALEQVTYQVKIEKAIELIKNSVKK